nr:cyclic-di-AMP phosphodiesterase PgpH [Candidatus Cloacimonadota bacterium]
MNSKNMLIIILTALVIVGLFHLFAVGRYSYPEFRLRVGQVSEKEIIAPFDFPIIKSPEQLSAEQEERLKSIAMPYRMNDEPLFEALSLLDRIWAVFYSNEGSDPETLSTELQKLDIRVDPTVLEFAKDSEKRDALYENLRNRLNALYARGIYQNITESEISLWQAGEEKRLPKETFLELSAARDSLFTDLEEAEGFLKALAPKLVVTNIQTDQEKYAELSQNILNEIPQTQGMVLQNEVIVRKNTRVTQEDIDKLASLQSAYQSRNVQRTPLQQMLMSFGLLIYIFTVLLLANHYYGATHSKEQNETMDYLPVNLGFILLILCALISNHLLNLNNLVIPFALTTVAATILVTVDYGILYSVCSGMLLSPFINWDSHPLVIFILGTIITLVLIKRQKAQHEYLTIWFYLLISYSVISLSLSIYNNDPIANLFQNIGFLIISSSLSIMGIIMIVPYYEKKWNRATKQTLLELLDFNHPLLKKMATSAVGTYHHSLIVGNLTERAAEAIGANPLLARVGSYYHDIGKTINTEIFTENNEESSEIHDDLTPDKSAALIKNHVSEGIALAKKYKIPQPVIDIIMQHHGNTTIRYFYDRAEKMQLPLDSKIYQYPGPRPQTKEAALVMIADIVESTTKAKNITSEQDIAKIIDDTISRLIRDEQLNEAPITMKDLTLIKEAMLPVLGSIYRKRLDYPDEDDESKHSG